MPSKRRAFLRFRPRTLTLIVFFLAAAVIVLANLSYDLAVTGYDGIPYRSYGWPLIWHRIVFTRFGYRGIGWYYSLPRLAANLLLWLLLLAALVAGCEWLLRRYRPRPRWSLRTLLAFVAVAAVVCSWYVHARNRAALQDPLIDLRGSLLPTGQFTTTSSGAPLVFVDRWGPKWLDLLGMDRLRRRVVLARNWSFDFERPGNEQQFRQLARAPDLRHLTGFYQDELTPTTAKTLGSMRQLETLEIAVGRLTPELPAALSELPQLRNLSVSWLSFATRWIFRRRDTADDNDARLADECLAAIGNMTHLETLRLSNLPLHGKGLACLGRLKGLKSFDFDFCNFDWEGPRLEQPVAEDSLRAIATLTQLEWLKLDDLTIQNESLDCLAALTNLKTLSLFLLETNGRPIFSHLPLLPRLQALGLDGSEIDDDLPRPALLPLLKSLSLGESKAYGAFTATGLAKLGSLDSLEELKLHDLSPELIDALRMVRGLKRLTCSTRGSKSTI